MLSETERKQCDMAFWQHCLNVRVFLARMKGFEYRNVRCCAAQWDRAGDCDSRPFRWREFEVERPACYGQWNGLDWLTFKNSIYVCAFSCNIIVDLFFCTGVQMQIIDILNIAKQAKIFDSFFIGSVTRVSRSFCLVCNLSVLFAICLQSMNQENKNVRVRLRMKYANDLCDITRSQNNVHHSPFPSVLQLVTAICRCNVDDAVTIFSARDLCSRSGR